MKIYDEIVCMIDEVKLVSAPVHGKSNLYTDIGLDSITFVTLLLTIEHRYSITFELLEMEQCLQLERLVELVEKKLEGFGYA